jgi:ribonuclease-3 family protein
MFEDILAGIKSSGSGLTLSDIQGLNPLVLAYIGDAVYEMYIRTIVIASEPNKPVHQLHLMSTGYVKAHAQSDLTHKISSILSDEELSVIRRGRNSKSGTVPKNADIVEYRVATGFEALVGYLYLTDRMKRLIEILNYAVKE